MRQPNSIDFGKYAERLGADSTRFQNVFQLALEVAERIRADNSLTFDKVANALCEHYGILLKVGSSKFGIDFFTVDSELVPSIFVKSLDSSLGSKVMYYHQLGHALLHAETLRRIPKKTRQEILEEADVEIFSIVVAIHDPEVTAASMLDLLSEWSKRGLGRNKEAFDAALAFFKENWVLLVPKPIVEEYAASLILTINDILLEKVATDPSLLHVINPFNFESLMAKVFADLGYVVEHTKRTRDGGIDILAVKKVDDVSLRFLIECKRYAEERRVGVSLVRELFGVKHHLGASKAIIATTSDFTKPAIDFAEAHKWELELKNREGIVQWIKSSLAVRRDQSTREI